MSKPSAPGLRARKLVWHYTTLETLQLILSSHTLLATEVSYQNDPREPESAHQLTEDTLQKLRMESAYRDFADEALRWDRLERQNNGFVLGRSGALLARSRFIFCASTDPDNLYAWRTYSAASQTGCAIGIDPTAPLGMIGDPSENRILDVGRWSDIVYSPARLQRMSAAKLKMVADQWNVERVRDFGWIQEQEDEGTPEELVETHRYSFSVLLTMFPTVVAEITAIAKHGSFRDEREARITVSNVASGVTFTSGAHGPRPRVRLASAEQWGLVQEVPAGRLPVRAIVLAPNARSDAATTVDWLLYANGYPIDPVSVIDESGPGARMYFDTSETIEIHRSRHPFQDA